MTKYRPRPINQILAALPEHEYCRLEPYLIHEPLSIGTVVHEGTEKIETVYFPNSALISLVNTLNNGTTTEIGIVGATGIVGIAALISDGYSNERAVVQIADGCSKISARILKQEFDRGGELQRMLLNYTQTRLNELSQLAVCNRHHTIEERLARWLLMVQDLTQYQELPLTQEYIGNMLGCGRSGVTISAGILQKAGLISYARGKIQIPNRNALENAACECYQLFHKNWRSQIKNLSPK